VEKFTKELLKTLSKSDDIAVIAHFIYLDQEEKGVLGQ
jgi:hypothetical protein